MHSISLAAIDASFESNNNIKLGATSFPMLKVWNKKHGLTDFID